MKKQYKLWTKDEIRKLISLWSSKTIDELCYELNCSKGQVMYMAAQIRKAGFKLPKKNVQGRTRLLVEETIKELKKK